MPGLLFVAQRHQYSHRCTNDLAASPKSVAQSFMAQSLCLSNYLRFLHERFCKLQLLQENTAKDESRNGIKDENALFVATNNFKVCDPSNDFFRNTIVAEVCC